MVVENPDPSKHWKIRRRTMFVSLALIVVFSIVFIVIGIKNPAALTAMTPLLAWVYGSLSLPVLGYYSNTAVSDFVKGRKH